MYVLVIRVRAVDKMYGWREVDRLVEDRSAGTEALKV